MKRVIRTGLLLLLALLCATGGYAQKKTKESLQKQINALQKEIETANKKGAVRGAFRGKRGCQMGFGQGKGAGAGNQSAVKGAFSRKMDGKGAVRGAFRGKRGWSRQSEGGSER